MRNLSIVIGILMVACSQPKQEQANEKKEATIVEDALEVVADTASQIQDEVVLLQYLSEPMDVKGFYPQLIKDGKALLYSTSNYEGLWLMDLETMEVNQITDKRGAGYKPVMLGDQVIYQVKAKIKHLEQTNLLTDEVEQISLNRSLLTPEQYLQQVSKSLTIGLASDLSGIEIGSDESKLIRPLGEGNYLFAYLSPDGSKIVTKCAGKRAVVCDLKGEILYELQDVKVTEWVDNQRVLYSKTADDGMQELSAEIGFLNIESNKLTPLGTELAVRLENPDYDPVSGRLVANSADGELFLFNPKSE